MSDNELSKIESLPPELAALFDEEQTENDFELVSDEDKGFPRIALMQGLSPLVISGEARIGEIAHMGNQKILMKDPSKPLECIPVFYWKSRLYFDEDNNLLCRSNDAILGHGDPGGECPSCPQKEWDNSVKPAIAPPCVKCHNFAAILPHVHGDSSFGIITMMKSSYKIGTGWIRYMRGLKGRMFTRSYLLCSSIKPGKKKNSVYANFEFGLWENNRKDRVVSDPQILNRALEIHNKMKHDYESSGGILVNENGISEEEVPF